jgi:prepilin-type N-terminal cleavage/methylation domain-containing protein
MKSVKITSGFTLIELAMVLFIVALILGGVLTPLSTRMEQASRKQAEEVIKDIKSSLIGYALVNGHLPCPDCPLGANANCTAANSNDGVEDGLNIGNNPIFPRNNDFVNGCVVQVGNVPWATLGVPEFDPWGQRFVYSVDQTFADDVDGAGACGTVAAGISFQLCSTGDMTIRDVNANNVATAVPALILSYGANGQAFGGTAPASAVELENWWTDAADRIFISNNYISNQFDDIVSWITTPELIYRMVSAERLP